jgi:flagellar biosynthesis protein
MSQQSPYQQQAVAIGYAPGAPAPKILGQGRGLMAEAILEKARELGIPTKTEPALVEFLMQLDLNAWIPPELFSAVAQVLAWAYEVDGSLSDKASAVSETLKQTPGA